jgi:uncharacterized protein YsxB (DUF464 family)
MIKADLVLEKGGLLRSCKVLGHAGSSKRGWDVVCAAVSVLVKTVFRVLSVREGITARSGAPERGELWLEVEGSVENREYLAAAGAFLSEGLLSVSGEFPEFCQVKIERRN